MVCRNCGSEVSAYVTECPYCGHRLRKRAPKLERHGDELAPRESRAMKRRRRAAERSAGFDLDRRPILTAALLAIPAVLIVVQRAAGLEMGEVGAVLGDPGSQWWRYLTASFAYEDIGYLFAAGLAIAIVCRPLEARIGTAPTAVLAIVGGALGIGAAVLAASLGLGDPVIAAGGSAIALCLTAALAAIQRSEAEGALDGTWDAIGIVVIAIVLLALPVVETWANPAAGIAGGLTGLIAGSLVSRSRSASL